MYAALEVTPHAHSWDAKMQLAWQFLADTNTVYCANFTKTYNSSAM